MIDTPGDWLAVVFIVAALVGIVGYAATISKTADPRRRRPEMFLASLGLIFLSNLATAMEEPREQLAGCMVALMLALIIIGQFQARRREARAAREAQPETPA